MKIFFYLVLIIGLLFSGCSTGSFKMFNDGDKNAIKTVSDLDYSKEVSFEWKVANGDRVQILVSNQSSSDGNAQMNVLLNTANGANIQTRDGTEGVLIPHDGLVRLPLVGAVKILGLTEGQATDKLTTAYRKYLRNPFISVKILNQKLFILGEVRRPGVIQVTNGTMSLFEALARSGDLTDDAERTNIKIIRAGLRKPLVREINLTNLSEMRLTSLLLQPNDIIYVQPRTMKAYNVAFKEQVPFFDMLSSMLSPFVSVSIIRNAGATDVFLFK